MKWAEPLSGNPFVQRSPNDEAFEVVADAVLALAHEQRLTNRLAAVTAQHRGITLPPDLAELAREGRDDWDPDRPGAD